jgi:hypothetical protein
VSDQQPGQERSGFRGMELLIVVVVVVLAVGGVLLFNLIRQDDRISAGEAVKNCLNRIAEIYDAPPEGGFTVASSDFDEASQTFTVKLTSSADNPVCTVKADGTVSQVTGTSQP